MSNFAKNAKTCLYVGYRLCALFLHHFEKSVDFLAKRKITILFQCNRVVEDVVVNFRIEKIDWEILKGLVVFTKIRSTSDYDKSGIPEPLRFKFRAKVKSVEWDIVFTHSKLFTDHVGKYDAGTES